MVSLPLINLWHNRSLVFEYSIMNMKLRYKGTYLGLLWAALEPLFMFVIMYVVFTGIREVRTDYAIYLISGIAMYSTFQMGTAGGLTSILDNSGMLKSINLQREFFPVASTGTTFFLMIVKLGILFALMPIFHFVPTWTIIMFPLPLILLILLIQGISYILSIVSVYFRDIKPLWNVFVYGLLFITPIFWYVDQANGILKKFQMFNPLGQIIDLFHNVILGAIPTINDWIYSSIIVIGIFLFGYYFFHHYEKKIMEML